MQIEFESAVVSALPPPESVFTPIKLGWLLEDIDPACAVSRFRCYQLSRVLSPDFASVYFDAAVELKRVIRSFDAIVVLNRLDPSVVELVRLAHHCGVPTILDLEDDLIAPTHGKNPDGRNIEYFLAILPFVTQVTTSSPALADRVKAYASDLNFGSLATHVVPDVAETWENYCLTSEAVGVPHADYTVPKRNGVDALHPKQVIWFGTCGTSHSTSGMFDLKPHLGALEAVHEEIPLELVIVSDSEAVYAALVHHCVVPSRYVPWSASAIYSELRNADVALIPRGDDKFSALESSRKVLQSLAAGVPVITQKSSSTTEFEDVIFSGRTSEMLRLCLGPSRTRSVPQRHQVAQRILARYTPERVGGLRAKLFKSAINHAKAMRKDTLGTKALIVVEADDSFPVVESLMATAMRLRGLDYEILVSIPFLENNPEIRSRIRKGRIIPKFFSDPLQLNRNVLLDASALVTERSSAPAAERLRAFAAELGIPRISSKEAATGSLDGLVSKQPPPLRITSTNSAGPYEEWSNSDGSVDWAFIANSKGRGWILEAICREIGSRQPGSWKVVYHPSPLPNAKNFFFSHYALFEKSLEDDDWQHLEGSNIFVWYTHPREEDPVTISKRLLAFEKVSKVIFACEANRQVWIRRGLSEKQSAVIIGGADPTLFQYHARGEGVVGLSSSFYERKNPDALLEIMKRLPHRDFLLLGRNWNQYSAFEEMLALPNFRYETAPYRSYPDFYRSFDVFLSMSTLEGGPIPLIEAMMSNAVPVASRTGFAPDVIRHGDNGFIFGTNASPNEIAALIELAFTLPGNIRQSVEKYDWDNFSSSVVKLAK